MNEPLKINRIEALSDAVFAVAMTILILELKIPKNLQSEQLQEHFNSEIWINLFVYLLSFVILGTYWMGTHFQHHITEKTDRVLNWFNILLVMFICVIPFSASFFSNYNHDKSSIIFYSCNLILASLSHFLMINYAWKKKYLKNYVTEQTYKNILKRIFIPLICYILAITFSFFLPELSLVFFIIPIIYHLIPGKIDKTLTEK
ncbi:MAG: TMEM175 family protein [Leadbetterella sp.]